MLSLFKQISSQLQSLPLRLKIYNHWFDLITWCGPFSTRWKPYWCEQKLTSAFLISQFYSNYCKAGFPSYLVPAPPSPPRRGHPSPPPLLFCSLSTQWCPLGYELPGDRLLNASCIESIRFLATEFKRVSVFFTFLQHWQNPIIKLLVFNGGARRVLFYKGDLLSGKGKGLLRRTLALFMHCLTYIHRN